ncbi:hypothetical protein ASZ90_010197 [hydrocarbon metagenome]|uniref:Uncharacterized protein n=1 Tax=hydrocarbon metagenome TaxID=938273 RepID=A0A0W8FGU3_9ZZZZ
MQKSGKQDIMIVAEGCMVLPFCFTNRPEFISAALQIIGPA